MAHPSLRTLLLVASLVGALHGQEFNPDAEVLTTPVPATSLPAINVNTTNVIHNNFQQAEPVVVPVAAPPQEVEVVDTAATTGTVATPAVSTAVSPAVSPAVSTAVLPTVNAAAAATPARLGVGFVPLGSLIASGMGLSGGLGASSAMTAMGGLGTLGAAMMPRFFIGR